MASHASACTHSPGGRFAPEWVAGFSGIPTTHKLNSTMAWRASRRARNQKSNREQRDQESSIFHSNRPLSPLETIRCLRVQGNSSSPLWIDQLLYDQKVLSSIARLSADACIASPSKGTLDCPIFTTGFTFAARGHTTSKTSTYGFPREPL